MYRLRFYLTLFCFFGLCETGVSKNLPIGTADGRMGTKCNWTREKAGDLCQISFYAVLANPEKYNGRNIALTGYLIQIDDNLVLFANKDSYDSGVEGEGVTLLGAKLSSELKSKVRRGLWPVLVVGKFDAEFSADPRPRLGAMREIFNVMPSPRMNPIRLKPANVRPAPH